MQIESVTCLHADAGFRNFDFLKITTDSDIVGWSEYNESFGGLGVTSVIENLAPVLIGVDPRPYELIVAQLYALRRQASGGIAQQAIGAIENALLDVKAKALGIPVCELFGGPIRDRLRLYWSHCGTYRVHWAAGLGVNPLETLEDITELGREVAASGYTALKTNIFELGSEPRMYAPGFWQGTGCPELNVSGDVVRGVCRQLEAFREGVGSEVDIMVDLNFNFKTEGFLAVARAMEPYGLQWVELDTYNPAALAYIRSRTSIPVASGESLFRRREYKPYLDAQAFDVAIIDAPWNGVAEAIKIASLADLYEVNVAPHNFYGHLATMMNAHFCAAIPNFRIMEIDCDFVPWHDDLFTVKPTIDAGQLVVPSAPGWGTDINEEAVAAHPPRTAAGPYD